MTPEDDRTTRVRRTLEGVLGVPATEGNRVDVLRNGDEIFPALFDAVDGAEHTIDFLTFVYWEGERRHPSGRVARQPSQGGCPGAGAARLVRRSADRSDVDQPHGGRGACTCGGSVR